MIICILLNCHQNSSTQILSNKLSKISQNSQTLSKLSTTLTMSVINTPQPIHEQIFAFAQHLGCPDEQIAEEMNKFFSLKVRKQRTKKAKAPKVDMPQCCARVWDHKN